MDVPRIRSAYDGSRVEVTAGGGDTMVREAFRDECDVNKIVARYALAGTMPLTVAEAAYGDVSEVSDYKTALDLVYASKDRLSELPDAAREMYMKDPLGYWTALDATKERSDLVELGLLEAPEEPVVDAPQRVIVVEDAPPAEPGE